MLDSDINLGLSAEISQYKTAMVEATLSMKSLERAVRESASASSTLGKEAEKGLGKLTGIGRGGFFLAVIAELAKAIQLAKQFDDSMASAAKRSRDRSQAAQSLAQGLTGVKTEDLAPKIRQLKAFAADYAVSEEQVEKLGGALLPGMKRRTGGEQLEALYKAVIVTSAGGSEEQAKRVGLRKDEKSWAELFRMEERARAWRAGTPGAEQAYEGRRLSAIMEWEKTYPQTQEAMAAMSENFAEERRRMHRGRQAQDLGLGAAVGEGGIGWWSAGEAGAGRFLNQLGSGEIPTNPWSPGTTELERPAFALDQAAQNLQEQADAERRRANADKR